MHLKRRSQTGEMEDTAVISSSGGTKGCGGFAGSGLLTVLVILSVVMEN